MRRAKSRRTGEETHGATMTDPDPREHRLRFTASVDDVDELGHISNVAYVRWLQDVAWHHSLAIGWDLAHYRRAGGVFVVRRHDITYVQPAYAGDEIDARTLVESWRGATCVRRTRVVRASDGVELAHASTLWVLVDPDTGRPKRIAGEIRDALIRLGAGGG
jgi:acyl-CoA thioester hydrolase